MHCYIMQLDTFIIIIFYYYHIIIEYYRENTQHCINVEQYLSQIHCAMSSDCTIINCWLLITFRLYIIMNAFCF